MRMRREAEGRGEGRMKGWMWVGMRDGVGEVEG